MRPPKQPRHTAPAPEPERKPMHTVGVLGLERQVPGCWDTLHGTQYLRVHLARLVPADQGRRLAITMALLNVHPLRDWRMWWRWKTQLKEGDMNFLLQLADPFIDAGPLERWQLTTLRMGRRHVRLVCSGRLLDSLGAEHWGEVDAHFMRWMASGMKDTDALRAMAALLYTDGPTDLEVLRDGHSLKLANAMPESYLLGIGQNWSQCRQVLVKANPNVFGGKPERRARSGGWGQVLMAYSGGRLGTWAETRTTPIRAFMANMNMVMAQQKPTTT